MPETCRDMYDNKSQLLHQVGPLIIFMDVASCFQPVYAVCMLSDGAHSAARVLFVCLLLILLKLLTSDVTYVKIY